MRLLALGEKGSDVANLQRRLNRYFGEPRLVADGIFGRKTDDAVREYQKANRLATDGVVGAITAKSLGLVERKPCLEFDRVQKAARDSGELVYALYQGDTEPMTQPGPWGAVPEFGYCSGLALRWIGLRSAGKDYPFDAETLESSGSWEATRDQNIAMNVDGDFLDRVEAVLRQYGVKVNRSRYQKSARPASVALIESAIFAGTGYYYVALRRKDGGHAIVIQREKSTYRIFDGNEGHFAFKSLARFKEFLQGLLVDFPGYLKKCTAGTWIIGVNA